MKASFDDHFSAHASTYARARPIWPRALAHHVAASASGQRTVADIGTGNGQLATVLGDYFERVEASDASSAQVHLATPHHAVRYRVAPATSTGLPDHSVDAITVAQALHWFATNDFFAEVRRIARPGAAFVAAAYQLFTISPDFDDVVSDLYRALDDDWPAERRHVEQGYAEIGIPWAVSEVGGLVMEAIWSLDDTLSYLRSWSATQRNIRRTGADPIAARATLFADTWGDPEQRRVVRWPLIVRTAIVEG